MRRSWGRALTVVRTLAQDARSGRRVVAMHIEVDRFLALTAMLAGFVPTCGPRRDEVKEAKEANEAHALDAAAEGPVAAPGGADGA
jgi:hypothetical protein